MSFAPIASRDWSRASDGLALAAVSSSMGGSSSPNASAGSLALAMAAAIAASFSAIFSAFVCFFFFSGLPASAAGDGTSSTTSAATVAAAVAAPKDDSKKINARRFAIVQVWRPIRGKVLMDPLGICDGRSIPQKGFIRVQRRYKDRTGEVYHIAHNPSHIWFHFPQMERHEALVFKVFDSDTSKPSRFTAHSAFDDPQSPSNAPGRESIETRTFAFFD